MAKHKTTIFKKILFPLFLVLLFQAALLFAVIQYGGTADQLQQSSFDILSEKVAGRKNELENKMVQQWSNLSTTVEMITTLYRQYSDGPGSEDISLQFGAPDANRMLQQSAEPLIQVLRKNGVTGAFLILESDAEDGRRAGLYFQDSDPDSNPSDNSDLLSIRSPAEITNRLNIPMATLWEPYFTLLENDPDRDTDFYFKPLNASREYPDMGYTDLGYWSRPFYLDGEDNPNDSTLLITYTVPLLTDSGEPFGVLGVEITTEYLLKWLPDSVMNDSDKSGYLLGICEAGAQPADSLSCSTAITSGSMLRQLNTSSFLFEADAKRQGIWKLAEPKSANYEIYASSSALKLYNTHTPFENEHWVLVGTSDRSLMLGSADRLQRILLVSLGLTMAVGTFSVFVAARLVSEPISGLVEKLRHSDPNKVIKLNRLNIAEVDELSDSIESLSQQVADASSRLSTILRMAGEDIAAYQYDKSKDMVYCTDQFFTILALPAPSEDPRVVPASVFRHSLECLEHSLENRDQKRGTYVFRINKAGKPRWLRLKIFQDSSKSLGVLTDITLEIQERRKIEHDRDYDLLTNIYNRRAFHNAMQELFEHPDALKTGALIMLDLDDLKYINDTYGHDYGDEYIRNTADTLTHVSSRFPHSLVARMSGDEFYIFLYGADSKEEIRGFVREMHSALLETHILFPGKDSMHIRASAGLAWYPDDSLSYQELIRYADFAMYKVKRTNKGQFHEFEKSVYEEERYLLQCKETLNEILERSMVNYQFQPIVEARTGKVFGYEALIRPDTELITNPQQLLSLARSQSKLSQIERLTWFRCLECFDALPISKSDCKLFINSIASQILQESDINKLMCRYPDYLDRLVVELTKEDHPNTEIVRRKWEMSQKWNAQLALDDFGSGYNGEAILADIPVHYIKLDISLIRNLHLDQNRLMLLQNLVSYSHDRGILVIAKGIETLEDMRVVIQNGVDYLQGYYLGRPSYNPDNIPKEIRQQILETQP